jgi:hypothetical protein
LSTLLYTPYDSSSTIDLSGGRIFRKQILPIGSIMYKGRRLEFTREYLGSLIQAFKDRAYDQVSFILADPDNRHNMNPENWRGSVRGFELTDSGLDGILELTPEAAKLVRENPRLGVSAQIVEGYERADGKKYPQAIRHVLGTLDPRVPGMAPWQAVDLAADPAAEQIDLTEHTFEGSADMARAQTASEPQVDPEVELEQTEEAPEAPEAGEVEHAEPEEIEGSEDSDEDVSQWSDEELQQFLDSLDDGAPVQGEAPAMALSNADRQTIDLANAGVEELRQHVAGLQAEVAQSRFAAERERFLAQGVPPHLVDLAAPVLSSPDAAVIDLSNGSQVDTAEVLRKVLGACAGYVDLAGEYGTSTTPEVETDPDQGLLDAWDNEYPTS